MNMSVFRYRFQDMGNERNKLNTFSQSCGMLDLMKFERLTFLSIVVRLMGEIKKIIG